MSDLISRKAAICAIERRLAEPAYQHTGEDWYVGMNCAESVLYDLPSTDTNVDMALKLNKAYDDGYETGYLQGKYDWIAKKKGHWNFIGDQMFECTECGVCYTQSQFDQMRVRITDSISPNFCPNCGADMKGKQDE